MSAAYIGCYEDATDRLLPSGFIGTADMTPYVCVQHCASLGFAYAGLEVSLLLDSLFSYGCI